MPARIEIAPELAAEGRALYETSPTSVDEIAARMKISRSTLYARMREEKWQRRRYSPTAAADAAPVASRSPGLLRPIDLLPLADLPAPVGHRLMLSVFFVCGAFG